MQEINTVDPQLTEALREIAAIIDKYEIGATVAVANREAAAFITRIPEWSGIQVSTEKHATAVRIKFKASESDHASSSLHLILSLRDLTTMLASQYQLVGATALKALRAEGVEVEQKHPPIVPMDETDKHH